MDLSNIVARISPSVAKLFCLDKTQTLSTGSGFIYSKKNILVTCVHVVAGSETILCKFPNDDQFYPAKVVITDPEHDLALLKVETDREPLAPFDGDPITIRAGMPVVFSGYPLNLEALTTHQGILSSVTKDAVGISTYLIDGTVNSGNSGCPLMNNFGEVIGVVNAKRRERSDLLNKVEAMALGAVTLHGIDLVEIYQALISNVQLGIGYAVPASYIPSHKSITEEPVGIGDVADVTLRQGDENGSL